MFCDDPYFGGKLCIELLGRPKLSYRGRGNKLSRARFKSSGLHWDFSVTL